MIVIKDKYNCCGCFACVQRCPQKCISMHDDNEGFVYPDIDISLCVNCGLCEKVCPVLHQGVSREPISTFAAINKNDAIRDKSSSGGIFYLLAEHVINKGGVVFGAVWNTDNTTVHHVYMDDMHCLEPMIGSKYIQSIIGTTYRQTEIMLRKGVLVLFSGTPCQISGLRLFLGKDYDNLVTVDFICHGVPSPGVFRTYLQERINKHCYGSGISLVTGNKFSGNIATSRASSDVSDVSVTNIRFRDKVTGWKRYSLTLDVAYMDGKQKVYQDKLSASHREDDFMRGFLRDFYLRPSCYSCPVKKLKSGADITIGDYWGYESMDCTIVDDDGGISVVMVNTLKGADLYESLDVISVKSHYSDVVQKNPAVLHSSRSGGRVLFFFLIRYVSFHRVISLMCSNSFFHRIIRKTYRVFIS